MRRNRLKYGFLSTHSTTVFIRRTGDYRFEFSLPIDKHATNPSLRECFMGFCAIAAQDAGYTSSARALMGVDWHGRAAIAKFWRPEYYERLLDCLSVWLRLGCLIHRG